MIPLQDFYDTRRDACHTPHSWMAHADRETLAAMMGRATLDGAGGAPAAIQAVAYNAITPIIASYAQCAAILDRIGAVPGISAILV